MRRNHGGFLFQVLCSGALLGASFFSSTHVASADSFDWRTVNGVNWNSPVKSQWGGTCWDFGTCSELEAKYMLTRNDPNFVPDISDQQMLWDTLPGTPPGELGFDTILTYTSTHGLVSETECPLDTNNAFSPGPGDPWPLASGWHNRTWQEANYQWVSTANLKSMIKSTALSRWASTPTTCTAPWPT